MAEKIYYDDTQLQKMFEALEPKARVRMFKGALRRSATAVRRVAVANLRARMQGSSPALEKGIRALVFKRTLGFRVTVGTKRASKDGKKKAQGFHTNRRGLDKPVLIWAEDGTQRRYTGVHRSSAKRYQRAVANRSKKGYRGKMPALRFMEDTKNQSLPTISARLQDEIVNGVVKTAKKYGCN